MSIVETNGEPTQPAEPHSEHEGRERVAHADKRLSTLIAQLALHGYTVAIVDAGHLAIQRWGWVRELSMDEAELLLQRLGVHRAR